jgi:homocysteine S-methyltransferase
MERGWLERLRQDEIVIIDGGTASELRRRGATLSADAWSATAPRDNPVLLEAIHAEYIRAGAELITTNTFATARFVLEAAGLGGEFGAINGAAVDAAISARAAANRPVAIAGSMSCLPPRFDRGAYPPAPVEQEAYHELAAFLADRGVDLIALEMMEDLEHARLAMAGALETGLPVCLGISVRRVDGRLVSYDYPARALDSWLQSLLALGPTVVNVMHTAPEDVGPALAAIRRHWRGPLGAYPELGDAGDSGPLLPSSLVAYATAWVGLGARLLGGCCGAGPEHIEALAAARPQLLGARHPRD